MESFEQLLDEATRIHGHICAGQVLGVRMAMAALERIGISDPKGADRKKLYVLVEIDRCATDAIQSVTGCSLGKRSLRWLDFGVMAATFVNLETGAAIRAVALEESRQRADAYCPTIENRYQRQLEAYRQMPLDELFSFQPVRVPLRDCDMPGRPLRRVQCQRCGDWVQDCRDLLQDGEVLCRACAGARYYEPLDPAPDQSGN